MSAEEKQEKQGELRLRIAGALIALGLLIEWFSLRTTTVQTFFLFAIAMGVCFPVGSLLFLSTLIRRRPKSQD